MAYWYKNYVEINLKYNTRQWYSNIIRNHIKPSIGDYKVSSLTPAVLQDIINKKFLAGYSKSTLSSFMGVLSKSLGMAVYPYQFIKQNPTQYIQMPHYDQVKSEDDLKTITVEQFKTILNRFPSGSKFYIPLQIAFKTGLRAGEVCGLTWDNIDLDKKKLKVEKNCISKEKGAFEYGTPKTPASSRTIDISDSLVHIIRTYKRSQAENKLKYGQYYMDSDAVCTKENGEPVTTVHLKYLSRVVNHNLEIYFNFHSLRHTHESMLLAAGANIKVIQLRVGHSKIATTIDNYAHVTKNLEESTAHLLESLSVKVK